MIVAAKVPAQEVQDGAVMVAVTLVVVALTAYGPAGAKAHVSGEGTPHCAATVPVYPFKPERVKAKEVVEPFAKTGAAAPGGGRA